MFQKFVIVFPKPGSTIRVNKDSPSPQPGCKQTGLSVRRKHCLKAQCGPLWPHIIPRVLGTATQQRGPGARLQPARGGGDPRAPEGRTESQRSVFLDVWVDAGVEAQPMPFAVEGRAVPTKTGLSFPVWSDGKVN